MDENVCHSCPADGSFHENSPDCACAPEWVSATEWRHRTLEEAADRAQAFGLAEVGRVVAAMKGWPL